MAVSSAQIVEFLLANPNMSDAEIASVMNQFGVSPADVAAATGADEATIQARFEEAAPTVAEPVYEAPPTRVIPTARGTVIEGDDIEAQIAGVPQVVYETRVDPNNKANWETFNPKTGEIIDSGTFAGGGDQGLLRAAAPVIGLAASTVGLPFISNLIGGATGLTGSALSGATGAAIGGGTQAVTGGSAEDILKAGLTGGAGAFIGSEISDLLKTNTPIDASGMTQAQLDASLEGQLVKDLQARGLTNTQISSFLDDMGIGQGVTAPVTTATPTVTTPSVTPTVPELTVTAPTTAPNLTNVINTITSTIPTVEVKSTRAKDETPTTPSLLTPTVPEVTVTGTRPTTPTTPITPIVPTVPLVPPVIPTTPPKPPTPPEPPPKKEVTITDVIKTIAPLVLAPAVASAVTPTKPTYPVVPVPTEWTPPTTQPTAPYQPLTPIDFGNQNLLKGTQWEKFLDPNYGKVPTPTQYSQPSNLSYNDLMGILGSKQGMPPASSLSINDVISGIQNQYGQTPVSAMGQKPA